jgi:hypothetical protein
VKTQLQLSGNGNTEPGVDQANKNQWWEQNTTQQSKTERKKSGRLGRLQIRAENRKSGKP